MANIYNNNAVRIKTDSAACELACDSFWNYELYAWAKSLLKLLDCKSKAIDYMCDVVIFALLDCEQSLYFVNIKTIAAPYVYKAYIHLLRNDPKFYMSQANKGLVG